MHRLIVTSALVIGFALVATPAQAQQVTHDKSSFSGTNTFPAGTICDFDYEQTFVVYNNSVIFGDPDNPDKVITYQEAFVTHTNLETGYALTEVDHFSFTFDAAAATFRQVGIAWHLRTPDGKIVVVQAGALTFNTNTGEVIKVTPRLNLNFAEVICPPLGGSPA